MGRVDRCTAWQCIVAYASKLYESSYYVNIFFPRTYAPLRRPALAKEGASVSEHCSVNEKKLRSKKNI